MASFSVNDKVLYSTPQSGEVRGIVLKIRHDPEYGPYITFKVTSSHNKVYQRGDEFPVWTDSTKLRKI